MNYFGRGVMLKSDREAECYSPLPMAKVELSERARFVLKAESSFYKTEGRVPRYYGASHE